MSSSKIYVGNLAWATDENALGSHFATIGNVKEAVVMRSEGRSRGFGFVTFGSPEEAEKAIATMNDTELVNGRRLKVNVANQQARMTGVGEGSGMSGGGYHYQSGAYQGQQYPAGMYNGYPQHHPAHHGGGFMVGGYGLNPAMGYPGNSTGFEGGSSGEMAGQNQKGGAQGGGFYQVHAPYGYPHNSYGQQPY